MGAGDHNLGFDYVHDRRVSVPETRNRRAPQPIILDRHNWPAYEAAGWFHLRDYPNDQELLDRAVAEAEAEYGVGKVAICGPWDKEHGYPASTQGESMGLYAQAETST